MHQQYPDFSIIIIATKSWATLIIFKCHGQQQTLIILTISLHNFFFVSKLKYCPKIIPSYDVDATADADDGDDDD